MKTCLLKSGLFVLVLTTLSAGRLLAFTAVTDGNWSDPATWGGTAPSTNVSNDNIIIPSGIDVMLDADVTFSGLLNNFTVDGTLTGTYRLHIQLGTFAGSGDVDIDRMEFSGLLATYTHTGDLTVKTFENSGSALVLTSQLMISDTLYLEDGSLSLNTGANLTLDANALVFRNDGTFSTSGGVFTSGSEHDVHYIGGSKTTGLEINSLNLKNVNISLDDNTAVLTMGTDLMVHGDLQLNTGILNVGANDLEIHDNMSIQSGAALTTSAVSNLKILTGNDLNSGLVFTSGSSIDQLIVEYGGSGVVELESPLSVTGMLQLHEGTVSIESGASLTMNAGSMVQVMNGKLQSNGGTFTGTASYDVEYMGDSTTTTGAEITGAGLNDLKINIASGDVVMNDDVTVGGELEMISGKLDLNANDLVLNGTLSATQAAPFIGDENSDLHLNVTVLANDTLYFEDDQNLQQLVVAITGGNIVLGSTLHIHDELTMTSGSIQLMNDDLIIEENADITGFSNTKYIMTPGDGMLQMHIALSSPYKVFPIGSQSSYSPASIQQGTGGAAGNFMVKAFNGVFTGGTENNGFNSAMGGSVVNRTWLVESDAGTLDINLKLGWMLASEVNGFDRTNAYISHYMDDEWDDYTVGAAIAGANSTYEISRIGITSLSPFSVADEDADLFVNEETALEVNLYPNPCTDQLNFSYTDANNGKYSYEVTDLAGRAYDVVSTGTNQMDVSALSKGTYLLKMRNEVTNKTAVRQFVKK
ncbi:hypothetical protein D3C87_84880 [compost metagenome]